MHRLRWLLVVAGVFLWLLIIYPAYYVVHKPLTPAAFAALADTGANLLTWLALLLVATALGNRLTRSLAYHSWLERLVFSAGIGLGIVSAITFFLALTGLLYGWVFWILIVGSGAVLWREIAAIARALRAVSWQLPSDGWLRFLVLFVAASLVLTLIAALLPPAEWDGLTYHLAGPERYLRAHRLVIDFDNYYLFFPAFGEMLFTTATALKGDIVAHLIHYGYLLLTLGAVAAFAHRYWDRSRGLLAVALFVSIPTALLIASWAYVDLMLTFYNIATIYALVNWLPRSSVREADDEPPALASNRWLVLAGVFTGFCLSIKYTGIVTLLVVGAVLLHALARRRLSVSQFVVAGVAVGAVALVIVSPWYIKNTLVTGNPVYPLVFGGKGWNEISTRWLLVIGEERSVLDLLIVPWTLTVVGTQGSVAYDSTYSPLFLALVPLLLLVRRKGKGVFALLVAAAVGYVFWLLSGMASYGTFVLRGRQLLPIFAPLSLLCAYALDGMDIWDRPALSLQRLLKMVAALTLITGLADQVLFTVGLDPWRYFAGASSRQDYLDRSVTMNLNQAVDYLNENLADTDRVLFLWEPRGYHVRVPHDADVLFDNFSQLAARYHTSEGIAAGLRQEGTTHLLVNHFIYPWIAKDYPITDREKKVWEEFQEEYLVDENLVHEEEGFLGIYRIPDESGP